MDRNERRAMVQIGDRRVGDGEPVYVIAEIGINHNGSVDLAKLLMAGARRAGCDAVKFQKRTPELAVPKDQWNIERDTPWGRITYIEYKLRMELSSEQYEEIDAYAKDIGIHWFASPWDEVAVDFLERFELPCYKIASASVTDTKLLERVRLAGRPVILSTGMSTMEEVDHAVEILGRDRLLIAHCTSAYPCPLDALNLRAISTLRARFPECPIGYSGHETGLAPTCAAVALGATFVERHITLDRALWGTDQAASVEVHGFERLNANIRDIEKALGDGEKRVFACEEPSRKKLRRA